jgi:hypothetical protein
MPRKEGSVSAGAAAGASVPAGAALASTDQELAIVGPYEAIPGAEDIVVMEPVHPQLEQRDYVVALLTFAAGLGAGAMVALGGSRSEDPPPKDKVRRADRVRRSNGKRR